MKNNQIFSVFITLLMILGLSSCTDREIVKIDNGTAPVLIDLSKETLILDSNFPGNVALNVNWKAATYSIPTDIGYDLEISATENFKTKEILESTAHSETYASFTTKEMNEAAKNIGLVPNMPQKMYFRVISHVGDGHLPQTSAVTYITITPYIASPTYKFTDLYLIGSSTAAGWDNNPANKELLPLLKTDKNNVYTFTGFFKASGTDGGFKIIKDKGSWDTQYGDAGAGKLSTDGGSGNLKVPTDGYYKLTIDTSALTYTITSVPTPTIVYNKISIIGTVNGNWNTDTQLIQSSFDSHMWKLNSVSLKAGEFKFRANNDWAASWGTNTEFFGTATMGGANIPLSSEWTYDVYFNDATGDYTLIPLK